jgi:hypothetical protein
MCPALRSGRSSAAGPGSRGSGQVQLPRSKALCPDLGFPTLSHRLLRHASQNVAPPQSLSKDYITFLIRGMYLKDRLRQIQTDRANLAHGRLPVCGQPRHLGTSMPSERVSTHHFRRSGPVSLPIVYENILDASSPQI